MLIVSGLISFDSSRQADLEALVVPLVEATLAESGNITYGFWFDPANPGVTRVYEEWESLDAIAGHMDTPHMATFLEGMGALGVTAVDINQHEVRGSTRLM